MGNLGALSAFHDRMGMSKTAMCFGISMTCVIYYMMYMACFQFWTMMAFNTAHISNQFNDAYFFYVNTIELLSFVFLRTRSTIKYFPKFITMANLMFLMYNSSYMYSCQFESLSVLQNFSFCLLCYFLKNYECEAVNNWSPFGIHTPTENNPRCAYQNVILSSEYSIGFDIFSLGMPVRFRESFTPQS
jgi:hypothetical protein